MKAVVVYESMYGNTHLVADAIGAGLRERAGGERRDRGRARGMRRLLGCSQAPISSSWAGRRTRTA